MFILMFFALFMDFSIQQTIVFSVSPMNQMGQILGPAPAFHVTGGKCKCKNAYSIMTNEENKKICGFLDQDMPLGTSLEVNLTPPKGARSMGSQVLSATPVDLVVDISKVQATGLPMVYTFSAEARGGVIGSTTRVVSYMLTDG